MTTSESPGEQKQEDDTALLVAALDHAWTWYDEHMKRVFQLINFYILAIALLVTAYASAINGKHYGYAVALAVAGLAITAIASASALNQANAGGKAQEALSEMQDEIACKLEAGWQKAGRQKDGKPKTSSFRMVEDQDGIRYNPPVAYIMIGLAALLFVAALIYAATR